MKHMILRLSFGAVVSVVSAQDVYVNQTGSLGPERNSAAHGFHLVEAAVNSLSPDGGTVHIAPGNYRERPTLRKPALLTRDRNAPGKVTIGADPGIVAETTLRFQAYNCRLFDVAPGQAFADGLRAEFFGEFFAEARLSHDFSAVCEVWETSPTGTLFFDTLRQRSGYPHGFYGGDYGEIRPNNSGLGLLSNHSLERAEQHVFENCTAEDCLAAKGWIQADITKDGFQVRLYITHTQASGTVIPPTEATDSVRREQLESIRGSIEHFLTNVPGGVAILMGDMNVVGESGEYPVFSQVFEALGGHDAARNAANGFPFDQPGQATTFRPSENNLAAKFCSGCVDERLDYVFYFPSKDGKVEVQPVSVDVLKGVISGARTLTVDGFTTSQLSDHYGLRAELHLRRLR
ncbi:MAG: hypothetical protein KDN22_16875 [Verrucomicrobiae bacterium]|nr:hypothetical protein [Verrucomicrobiae bacterium]